MRKIEWPIQRWVETVSAGIKIAAGTRIARRVCVTALPLSLLLAAAPACLLSQGSLPLTETSRYAGSELCALCHQDRSIDFQTNPHVNQVLEVDGVSHTGCENCHGPGENHTQTMNPDLISRFGIGDTLVESGRCLNCHAEEGTHPDRFFDAHQSASIGCVDCHSVHDPGEPRKLLRSAANELCASCHPGERAAFRQPFTHPLDQGITECIDCHTPHGSPGGYQLLRSNANEATCLSCHSDKRGPFAFEHMPTLIEGCAGCHAPHGSANPRMLVRHEVRLVCLECHTNSASAFAATPPAFHDLRSDRIQNCTLCHIKIHGSHVSPAFLR